MIYPATYEHDGQRLRILSAEIAYLDFDLGRTERWSDEKMTDVAALDYRKSVQYCFCIGCDEAGSSVVMDADGRIVAADNRDIGHMIFGFRPPKPNAEILAFYNAARG